jgi:capsular exopolysaccharide synthesis family protein
VRAERLRTLRGGQRLIGRSDALGGPAPDDKQMHTSTILHALRRRWLLVIGSAVLAIAAAAAAIAVATPQYESHVQLFVSAPNSASDAQNAYQGGLFSQQRVLSYADIVGSPSVLDPVVRQLRLATTSDDLAKQIRAEVPADTVLVNIFARDPSARTAQEIADAVGKQFASFAEQLERPDARGGAPVQLSVSRPASLPTSPVSPKKRLILAVALLGGLLIGVALALTREALDTSVKQFEDLETEMDIAPAGAVPFQADFRGDPVRGLDAAGSIHAEALRQVRTSVQFLNVDSPPRSLLITSALDGEGKSSLAAGLATVFGLAGASTVLVEADLRRPSLSRYLGLAPLPGLSDVLLGVVSLSDALQRRVTGETQISVLTAGTLPPRPAELLGSERFAALVAELHDEFDFVLLDAPPLLPVADATILAPMTDGVLLVVREGKTPKSAANRALGLLKSANVGRIGVVLSMVRMDAASGYRGGYYTATSRYTDAPVPSDVA